MDNERRIQPHDSGAGKEQVRGKGSAGPSGLKAAERRDRQQTARARPSRTDHAQRASRMLRAPPYNHDHHI